MEVAELADPLLGEVTDAKLLVGPPLVVGVDSELAAPVSEEVAGVAVVPLLQATSSVVLIRTAVTKRPCAEIILPLHRPNQGAARGLWPADWAAGPSERWLA